MERAKLGYRRRTGSVKAAKNLYGDKVLEGSPSLKIPQMDLLEVCSKELSLFTSNFTLLPICILLCNFVF
jgi:hypothetical protein